MKFERWDKMVSDALGQQNQQKQEKPAEGYTVEDKLGVLIDTRKTQASVSAIRYENGDPGILIEKVHDTEDGPKVSKILLGEGAVFKLLLAIENYLGM